MKSLMVKIIASIILTACIYSISMVNTYAQSQDLVDETPISSPSITINASTSDTSNI